MGDDRKRDLLGNDAPVTDPAALVGDPTRHDNSLVVHMQGENVRLEGCVITGGADGGGAWARGKADIFPPGMIISDCTFRANRGFLGDLIQPGAVWATGVALIRCSLLRTEE